MQAIEVVLALLVVVTALAGLARRFGVPDPVLLVLAGLGIGFIPGMPHPELEPDLVFLLFLPPILYGAAFFTSIRDFRANLRPILLLSVGLVLFSMVAVAVVTRALVPDLPWAAAFALGAIVAPPDAVAATAVFRRLGVPRRMVTILEGESLVNDATALVALRTAVVALGGTFSVFDATVSFFGVAIGGIVVGLVVGRLSAVLTRRIEDPVLATVISLLVPAIAFLPAESIGVSGVLSVVTAGLMAGRLAPRDLNSAQRVSGAAAWEIVLFLINGIVFVLIGLQLPRILEELEQSALELAGLAVAVSVTAIVARYVWVYPATYLPHLLSRRVRANERRPSPRYIAIIGWAGMRGVVSLAAALSLPLEFPGRSLILFLTFAVILATLVLQGLTLPLLIRVLRIREDRGADAEELLARRYALEAAVDRIGRLEQEWGGGHQELIDQLRTQYAHRSEHLGDDEDGGPRDEMERELLEHRIIRRAVIDAERAAVIRLRDQGDISDAVMRRLERDLDLEELRLEA